MSTTVNLAKVRAKADEWISYAGDTIAQVNWRDLALVKLCLCALGVIIGLCVPKEKKKIVLISTLVGIGKGARKWIWHLEKSAGIPARAFFADSAGIKDRFLGGRTAGDWPAKYVVLTVPGNNHGGLIGFKTRVRSDETRWRRY